MTRWVFLLGTGMLILSGRAEASFAGSSPVPQSLFDASAQGCGVGTCFGSSYCDDCLCYSPDSPVSQLFCGCSQCGEVTRGCGPGTCVGASFCDSCLCYSPASAVAQTCCPGGTGNFQILYESPSPSRADFGHAIAGVQTFDNGFILAGFGFTANVIRTDDAGHLVWSRLIGGSGAQWWDVAQTSEGFLLTGKSILAKLDHNGNLVWAKALPNNGIGYGVAATRDGGIVVSGTMTGQAFLLKTDADGSLQWGWTYGGSAEARSAVELPAGGFMVFGSTQSFGAGGYDLLFIETDAAGTLQWAKTAGGAENDKDQLLPYRMIGTDDGGFVVATSTQSFGGGGIFVMKLDASVDVMWANTYGGGSAEAIAQTLHGYFVLGTRREEFLLALDPNGAPQWAREYGDTPFNNYVGGGLTFDGGAFLVTESHINPKGTHKFLLVKTDANGRTLSCNDETSFSVTANKVSITTVAATLTANALSGQLSPIGVSVQDGGLVDRALCQSSPIRLCETPLACRLRTGQTCVRPLPPL